jgi:hypothetical protein
MVIKCYIRQMALMCLVAVAALAQEVQLSIQANPASVDLGQRFQLTVTVAGSMNNVPEPNIKGLEPFNIIGSSQSSQISIVNGRISSTKNVNYTIVAGQKGSFTLGPAVITLGDKTVSSNTVTVTVGQGGGGAGKAKPSPPAGQPPAQQAPAPPPPTQQSRPGVCSSTSDGGVFIRGATDKKSVYLGQQVTYTFGFFSRVRMTENPEYSEPKFSGFWKEDIDREANVSNRSVNGALYRVQELRYALFPTVSGKAKISSATLAFAVRNVWDFFDRGRRVELETGNVEIEIKPLPEAGKPSGFSGAVGRYKISASLDKQKLNVGDALTLNVVVEGSGNVRTIDEPSLTGLENFDVYESSSDVNVGFAGSTVQGRKTFKFVIVPRKDGEYDWPGIEFSFFDPERKKYSTVSTGNLKFSVFPSEKQETVTYRTGAESVVSVGEDINYIKEDSGRALSGSPEPLSGRPWFWLLHLLPFGAVGVVILLRRHRGRLMSDRGYARYRGADRKASAVLKKADKAARGNDYADAYASLNSALTHYIGDRLNAEVLGMTAEEIDSLLDDRAVPEQVRRELRELMEHFSLVRFALGAGADSGAYREYRGRVRKLLDRLGRKL